MKVSPVSEISPTPTGLFSAIHTAVQNLDENLLGRPGGIFYSGPEAFAKASNIYFLGLNPGGSPPDDTGATIRRHYDRRLQCKKPWSAYLDEEWGNYPFGEAPIQERVRHMMRQLDLNPRLTPASNLIFVQTPNEKELGGETGVLVEQCWPVHQAVITSLGVRVVVCFGKATGAFVRQQLGAHEQVDDYSETYPKRHWTSLTHKRSDGFQVVTLTHPSRANWCNEKADPTGLVARSLARA